jgi:hypothetical protein
MRKVILICALFCGFLCNAQDTYFTTYRFTVEPENVSAIYNLFDSYYSEAGNKPEGVTVALYENHLNDSGNNHSHSVVFSGTLDAMGGMYDGGSDDAWNLFLTKVNQLTKEGFSSASGKVMSSHGESDETYRFQRYYLVDVDETDKFKKEHDKYMEKHLPNGMTNAMGSISIGQGPDGGNTWVINRFKDFKSALGGANSLRTEDEIEASKKAYEERWENSGDVSLVRSGLRILLKSW